MHGGRSAPHPAPSKGGKPAKRDEANAYGSCPTRSLSAPAVSGRYDVGSDPGAPDATTCRPGSVARLTSSASSTPQPAAMKKRDRGRSPGSAIMNTSHLVRAIVPARRSGPLPPPLAEIRRRCCLASRTCSIDGRGAQIEMPRGTKTMPRGVARPGSPGPHHRQAFSLQRAPERTGPRGSIPAPAPDRRDQGRRCPAPRAPPVSVRRSRAWAPRPT